MSDSTLNAGMPGAADIVRMNAGGSAASKAALNGGKKMTEAQIRKTAQDFEAFFISQAFQPMFSTVKTDDTFGGGQGEDTWKSMLVDEYGKKLARSGGIGIADQVMKAMLKAQEEGQG